MIAMRDGAEIALCGIDPLSTQDDVAAALVAVPAEPSTTDVLTIKLVMPSVDPDGDTVAYAYRWYRNREVVKG